MIMELGNTEEGMKRLQIMIVNFLKLDNGTLSTDVNMRQYGIEAGEPISNAIVQELCIVHPHLLKLNLSQCKLVTDVGMWSIAKHCPNVEHLILQGCDKITHVGLRAMGIKLTRLLTLDISYCYLVDDVSVTVIAAGSWKLQNINFAHCHKISDNGLNRLAEGLGNHIETLDCSGCTNVGEFGDRGLKSVGFNCAKLKELYVDSAKRVEDEGLNAIATGCPLLEILMISGCDNITDKSFRNLCRLITEHKTLHTLKMVGINKVKETDFKHLLVRDELGNQIPNALTNLEFSKCPKLSDRAIAVLLKAVGPQLSKLSLIECVALTDISSHCIGQYCHKLRELNYNYTPHITDASVHCIAKSISCLTSLKLEGNTKVTTRTLLTHIEKDLEFVEMSAQWFGYSPKPFVEKLIIAKQIFILHTAQAVKIQAMIRRKFALKVYWKKYTKHLVDSMIPLFQGYVRGYFQRKRYRIIRYNLYRIQMIIKIQNRWRIFMAMRQKVKKIQKIEWNKLRNKLALMIQTSVRRLRAQRRVERIRLDNANKSLAESKLRALHEMQANFIQRIYRGYVDRKYARRKHYLREADRSRRIYLEKKMRLLQRIGHGCIGRIRARRRRWEIAHHQMLWESARNIQRVYRGHLGRLRYQEFVYLANLAKENAAATEIQRMYRGYRGTLLAAVARALKILRIKQNYYALEIQRTMRGCVGRHHFKVYKELETRRKQQNKCAIVIQRVFRGHKGREAKEIEGELTAMEGKARPLIAHLKHLEESAVKLSKVINTMEFYDKLMTDNLFELGRELEHCLHTTSKYTDSSRINNTPQRFLTKFLKVRLKDHLEMETEIHRVKYIELQKRRAELRDLNFDIASAQRELIPLTTGLIADVKKRRGRSLRQRIYDRKNSAIKIQALWRRALVRSALYDEYRQFWEVRIDRDTSDRPYYINTFTKEITWKKPLAYTYFTRVISIPNTANTTQGIGMGTVNSNATNDKVFGTSNMSTKLRSSISSAKLISTGASIKQLSRQSSMMRSNSSFGGF